MSFLSWALSVLCGNQGRDAPVSSKRTVQEGARGTHPIASAPSSISSGVNQSPRLQRLKGPPNQIPPSAGPHPVLSTIQGVLSSPFLCRPSSCTGQQISGAAARGNHISLSLLSAFMAGCRIVPTHRGLPGNPGRETREAGSDYGSPSLQRLPALDRLSRSGEASTSGPATSPRRPRRNAPAAPQHSGWGPPQGRGRGRLLLSGSLCPRGVKYVVKDILAEAVTELIKVHLFIH
ncbi:hypothetical protein NDU88_007340 [Pleurodeles waltl]|uniref:Uncharacterized protein n=1 Tax=Pleurodeles waltl TaxID=8319 RepID=A0AAV7NVY5_PLEWA|nr:hypothetical protein NDU88_007340 [Pleurodeles waltl]